MSKGPFKGRFSPGRAEQKAGAFTMVELLVVITIITFVAGALVVAARGVMVRAHAKSTEDLVQRLTTAAALFKDDFGYYPPDDLPITRGSLSITDVAPSSTNPKNAAAILLEPNANLILRLLYLYPAGQKQYVNMKASELAGNITSNYTNRNARNAAYRCLNALPEAGKEKGLVAVDAWGRPLYYDCHTPDPGPNNVWTAARADVRWRIRGVGSDPEMPVRNAKGVDIFSCGPDGLTSTCNSIDDNQNGAIDDSSASNVNAENWLIGEDRDDINNWSAR